MLRPGAAPRASPAEAPPFDPPPRAARAPRASRVGALEQKFERRPFHDRALRSGRRSPAEEVVTESASALLQLLLEFVDVEIKFG